MPVEDIEFLIANSVQDNSLLFIDSALRNYEHYPTPSEYVIELEEPIRNVFGLEVLDSAIANSMYNIDFNNNHLRFINVLDDPEGGTTAVELAAAAALASPMASSTATQIAARDAAILSTLNGVFNSLGHATPVTSWMADPLRQTYAIAIVDSNDFDPVQLAAVSTPPGSTTSLSLCYVFVRRRLQGVAMTVYSNADSFDRTGAIEYDGAFYKVTTIGSVDAVRDMVAAGAFSIQKNARGAGYYDVTRYDVLPVSSATFVSYTGLDYVDGSGTLSMGGATGGIPIRLAFVIASATIEKGNYNANSTFAASVQSALDAAGISASVGSTTISGFDKQGILKITTPATSRLVLCRDRSSAADPTGFSIYPNPKSDGVLVVGNDAASLMFSTRLASDGSSQSMTAPGILNLAGVRYVTLRCPEIEAHIGSTGKYGIFSTGIGVFKLQNTNQVAQVRSDYINLVRKPFHPIGKLVRLTFRFELLDGTLFDFKGINNQLLISIKYYAPGRNNKKSIDPTNTSPTPPLFKSVLNPDYDGDFHRYIANHRGEDAFRVRHGRGKSTDDDDDDDEDEFDEDEFEDDDEDGIPNDDDRVIRRLDVETQMKILDMERRLAERR